MARIHRSYRLVDHWLHLGTKHGYLPHIRASKEVQTHGKRRQQVPTGIAMNDPMKIGRTLLRAGVLNAHIKDYATGLIYEFIRVSALECRFGVAGEKLTEYVIDSLKLEPHSSYGDLMTIDEFIKSVEDGSLTNYDGSGRLATATRESNISVKPSDYWYGALDTQWTHVMWFNK